MTRWGWSLWLVTFALTVLLVTVSRVTFQVMAVIVVLVTGVCLVHVRRVARRAHWVLLLDGRRLTIEREPRSYSGNVHALDVSEGVRLDVVADKRLFRLDTGIALFAAGQRAVWTPDIGPGRAMAALTTFLRENGVVVSLPPNGRLGWFPPDFYHR